MDAEGEVVYEPKSKVYIDRSLKKFNPVELGFVNSVSTGNINFLVELPPLAAMVFANKESKALYEHFFGHEEIIGKSGLTGLEMLSLSAMGYLDIAGKTQEFYKTGKSVVANVTTGVEQCKTGSVNKGSASNAKVTSELPRGLTWNEFQKQTKGLFKNTSTKTDQAQAAEVYKSFQKGTIKIEYANDSTFIIRFTSDTIKTKGRYVFPSFDNYINRDGLALPMEWNRMNYINQFQIKEGAMYFSGRAGPQVWKNTEYPGGAIQYFVPNPQINLKDIK